MRFRSLALAMIVALTVPACAATQRSADPSAAAEAAAAREYWQGELSVGAQRLLLGVTIGRLADGTLVGALDVPAQGAKGIPISGIVQDGRTLSFTVPAIKASFEGTVDAAGAAVGQWRQGGMALPLTLAKAAGPAEARRPQTPLPPFPYRAEEVAYVNPKDGTKLAGTLTLPRGEGRFPAVLLITGSGAQDRDETILGHKPFLLIADHLTRRGIAVLRVDDRGVGGSSGDPRVATTLDFVGDVEAGLAFLRRHAAIDVERVGLLGHSEGGLIAPIVAARHPGRVAFLVLLAAPGLPGGEVILDQIRAIRAMSGQTEAQIRTAQATQERLYQLLRTTDREAAAERLKAFYAAEGEPLSPQLEAMIEAANSPWFRTFIDLDPRPSLRQVKVPVLAINGDRDRNVDAAKHLSALRQALAGNPGVTTRALPGLNHLFQPAETGLPAEYGAIETTFDPAALDLVGDWVAARTKR